MSSAVTEKQFEAKREAMVEDVSASAHQIHKPLGLPDLSHSVLAALRRVPRHRFVPETELHSAYYNEPLPIGLGQTISQPYIVALMTDLLSLGEGDKVLEIGTGSGYQSAVLAEMGARVFSIEVIAALAASSAKLLNELGYDSIRFRQGDGYAGWPEEAPFDSVILTAAATQVPQPLLEQLKVGGRMVIPIGFPYQVQQLVLVEKLPQGTKMHEILPVRFVPLTGAH